ncbi:MAG: type III-B CRISPR module RAMP protein Cmr6 [Fimbriimonadales bacterium]|nr:MAG: type III-B CRISPR module RAMP protein Cmr6 [Fimbriimonadales bacterium]
MIVSNGQYGVLARRNKLQSLKIPPNTHPSLALQRYLQAHKPKQRDNQATMPEEELLNAVAQIGASDVYKAAFQRWQRFATGQPSDRARVQFTLTASSPIAIGLGNASPLEVGLTLHHTYGMPILPGSALKGLCRRGARHLLRDGKLDQREFDYLFGTGGDAHAAVGAVVFYDAWYVPDSVQGKPFHRDVITVHHPQYYGSRGKESPTDFDDPNPVPFLVVKPSAQFLFVLEARSKPWAEFTKNLLVWCLANLGVGAKTNAGYGYLAVSSSASQRTPLSDPFQAHELVWEQALVKWIAGSQQLHATNLQNQKEKATISGAQAKQIFEKFAPETQEKLKTKGIQAQVKLQKTGNQRTIVDIIPQE